MTDTAPGPPRPVILAVDDDPAVLSAVRGDLRIRYGRHYRVITASGGTEAVEALNRLKLRGDPVAVVVSDQRMPEITGTEVLTAALKLFPDVRTVLLTAYADTEVAIGAINDLHLDYYILKPWDPPEERLFPVIDDLLEDWHAHNQPTYAVTRLVGSRWSARTHEIRDFLQRNQIPMQWLDVDVSEEGRHLSEAAGDGVLPLVITPDGSALHAPDVATLATALGHKTHADAESFDLAIIGAGPAGLAAAVYGASEGLRTICVEQLVPGGQAGQSSRIENYLGFPTGISGADLARRAVTQARRFHVEVLAPTTIVGLDLSGPYPRMELADGSAVSCGSIILACGVAYHSLDVPGSAELEGRGVFYGASLSERDTVIGEDIVVVGGANSAGQAAVFFSEYARSVTILCRANELGAKMSTYLVDQIAARPNITVRCRTFVRSVGGADRLETMTIEDAATGSTEGLASSALFVFVGASPRTDWLPPQIARDDHGFILTGPALGDRRHRTVDGDRDPFLYETSAPGVFAVGDVRAGSTKRVASAVGEGSVAVQFVHQVLRS
ncbi:FAD-dependent oxidoreductase [Paenarthrobacter sp. Z7-10]|uniref:FAD-dependent oxidoreductase n=1 Tax=Paenarthrobacter sp. Z7-10 TaxID=2787635 RepID=UPI0022A9AB49|nr:FAD-dependent oxidoreductase [Paenarthrobacter sp. Z7-10]MCZ2404271.1 FAD-dependent oxidoreductase [Paenarthrobacter sp. Z7-10]